MTDPATMEVSARLGWKILAKAPSLTGWLLRRVYPLSKRQEFLILGVSGNNACFYLQPTRPFSGLTALGLEVHNHLPTSLSIQVFRAVIIIDSILLLDQVLNLHIVVPSSGSGTVSIPELVLNDQQVGWIKNLRRESTRIRVQVYLRCKSSIHAWDDLGVSEFPVPINT